MKTLLMCFVLLFSTQIFAEGDGKGDWEARKAKKIEMMNKRLERVKKYKACLEAAGTKEAFHECMKSIRSERKGRRAAHKK